MIEQIQQFAKEAQRISDEGRNAAKRGAKISDCPYSAVDKSVSRICWIGGFSEYKHNRS